MAYKENHPICKEGCRRPYLPYCDDDCDVYKNFEYDCRDEKCPTCVDITCEKNYMYEEV